VLAKLLLATTGMCIGSAYAQQQVEQARRVFVDRYCATCHSTALKTGGVILQGLDATKPGSQATDWERVLRKVRSGQMPPTGAPHAGTATTTAFISNLESALDKAVEQNPNPGAPMPHRLNRTEYSNAIRDLLALDTNPGSALPVDDSGSGFDNMGDLLSMSPALLEAYISSARRVSKLAVGDLKTIPTESRFINARGSKPPLNMPIGSRGGISASFYFPLDAEYLIRVELTGGGDEEGSAPKQELRIPIKAGLHTVVATFLRESAKPEVSAPPTGRRPAPAAGPRVAVPPALLDIRLDGVKLQRYEIPARGPAAPDVTALVIGGPHKVTGRGDTPSRARIFTCRPGSAGEESECAKSILSNLARRAFRRPVTDADIQPLLRFYAKARNAAGGDFDSGIQSALEAMLVSADFLFRVERDPKGAAPGSTYKLGPTELASRLSFFLWSSIPDDELLKADLRNPVALKTQIGRMLVDPASDALIKNFAGQWLYLRTLENLKPDADIFSNFDENLRAAFREETELFVASVFREDRSIFDLLQADYTYLNQRLAEHYKIPNVYGSHFRRVTLPADSERGGLLGQGSILTVTSYPNRTSVVQRGKWILENLLSTPPPPPPGAIPELAAKSKDGKTLTLRQALEVHRDNPSCSGCHSKMDPIGFALENYDAVGAWRTQDAGSPIDARGQLPGSPEFNGPAGLKKLLLASRRDEFAETVAEKMLTYALGRSLEAYDRPAVRTIIRKASKDNYRMSAFIHAVIDSTPFQMRRVSTQ
jgi:hypothetical protein